MLCWVAFGLPGLVWAQTASPAEVSGVQALDKQAAEQERLRQLVQGKPAAYQDKVMEPDALKALEPALESTQSEGFRSWLVETRLAYAQNQVSGQPGRSNLDEGLRFSLRQESFNYGDWLVDADLRNRSGQYEAGFGAWGAAATKTGMRLTLRNEGLALTPGLSLSSALGDQMSGVTDAFARSYRLSLGSSTVRGVGFMLRGERSELRVGSGRRGMLLGGPYPGFQASSGQLSWLGYTQQVGEQGFVGLQLNQATGMPANGYGVLSEANPADNVRSYALSVGQGYGFRGQGSDFRWRAMYLASQASAEVAGRRNRAQGVLLESGLRWGSARHEMGLYNADADLKFGDNTLLAGSRGVFWRVDQGFTRGSWGLGLDYEQVNPAHDPARFAWDRLAVNVNGLRRLSRDSHLGASLNLTHLRYTQASSLGPAGAGQRSMDGTAYYQTRLGQFAPTRLRLTVRRNQSLVSNGDRASGEELEWEQDWLRGRYETQRPELTTSLGWGRDVSTAQTQKRPSAGVVFREWFASDGFIAGSLRYTSRSGNLATSRGLSGVLSTETGLGRTGQGSWRLGASVSLNQATVTQASNLFDETLVTRSNDKVAQLYLRWEGTAGRPFDSVGFRANGAVGGGTLRGEVFFDANRDGERQFNEAGVAGVELLLDGRYRVVTDAQGRFEIAAVATGKHRVNVNLDSVPLPWGLAADDRQGFTADVPLRGAAALKIGVVKVE